MSRRRRHASGKRSRAICERSGFEIPYKYLVREPGTNLLVDKRWSDGYWNLVDHPQNFSPKDLVDAQQLKFATGNENTEFATASVIVTNLYDETGQQLFTVENGDRITDQFNRIEFNSLKKVK